MAQFGSYFFYEVIWEELATCRRLRYRNEAKILEGIQRYALQILLSILFSNIVREIIQPYKAVVF